MWFSCVVWGRFCFLHRPRVKTKKQQKNEAKSCRNLSMGGGYVPPHLRASDAAESTSSLSGGGNGAFNNDDSGGFGPSAGERSNHQQHRSRTTTAAEDNTTTNKIKTKTKWQPSERVLNLTKSQIEDMRERLNVLAESPEEDTNEYAPIESFEDMKLDREIALSIKAHGFDKPTRQSQIGRAHV